MTQRTYDVQAISCGHCTATIEREIGAVPGVLAVHADKQTRRVQVEVDAPARFASVESMLDEIGFPGSALEA